MCYQARFKKFALISLSDAEIEYVNNRESLFDVNLLIL
jgi:hypothetical protein